MNDEATSQVLRIAMDTLATRIARWTCLVMSFALFAAAAWWPDWQRFAAAVGFTVLMSLPIWLTRIR